MSNIDHFFHNCVTMDIVFHIKIRINYYTLEVSHDTLTKSHYPPKISRGALVRFTAETIGHEYWGRKLLIRKGF